MINNDAYLKAIDSMLETGDVQSPSGLAVIDIDTVSKILLALGYRPVYYESMGLVWPMDQATQTEIN